MSSFHAQIDGAVAWLVIDNPERRNAMNLGMYAAVPAAVQQVLDAPDVRVAILRGAGDAAFGAGSDISEFAEKRRGAAAADYAATEAAAQTAIASMPLPVLAMIHGPCMGGGIAMAMAADVRYAADDATFSVPPGRLGVGFPAEGVHGLIKLVGRSRALELLYTARVVEAAEAAEIGLADGVLAKADLEDFVAAQAATIAARAPLTLKAVKAAVTPGLDADAAVAACFASDDYREGIAAFAEKRRPTFRGH